MRRAAYVTERRARLARLARQRLAGAPRWVLRSEQIGLAATRRGAAGPRCVDDLVERYGNPAMEDELCGS